MDMGKMTSKQIGEMTARGILRAEEQLSGSQNQIADMGRLAAERMEIAEQASIPATIKNQNVGHNSKKVGLGPNTKRK